MCYTKDVIEKLVERNKEVFLMTGLKWFAGGKERREQAVAIIDEVIETIGPSSLNGFRCTNSAAMVY